MECMTVENMISGAYGVFANGASVNMKRLPITGGANWTRTEFYAINAKAEDAAPVAQMMGPMLRTLLEDRFQLKVHHESKEGPVYLLTVAKGGLKLQRTKEGSCIPLDLNHLPGPPAPGQPPPNICGNQRMRMMNGRAMTMSGNGLTLADLAGGMLANLFDRPVIDKTGVEGQFDIELEFAPDSSTPMFQGMGRGGRGEGGGDAGAVPLATDPEGPTIVMALEKPGLKLEPSKGPIESLVIDHVERPSEN